MRVISPSHHLCDAVGGALNYLGSECDHLPEAGKKRKKSRQKFIVVSVSM